MQFVLRVMGLTVIGEQRCTAGMYNSSINLDSVTQDGDWSPVMITKRHTSMRTLFLCQSSKTAQKYKLKAHSIHEGCKEVIVCVVRQLVQGGIKGSNHCGEESFRLGGEIPVSGKSNQ